MTAPKLAYISFDIVPALKGAAIHISAFATAIAAEFGQLQLVTVSPTEQLEQSSEFGIQQTALPAVGKTLIDRVLSFRAALWQWLQGRSFDIIHIRSPFEGLPVALHKPILCRHLIFEVNGLPSIELKYRYPKVADDRELMHKLTEQERICRQAADCLITPSPVTQAYLHSLPNSPAVHVIPNGVALDTFYYAPPRSAIASPLKLLYFGTLSPWQGVDLAIDALALYRRDQAAQLTIAGPTRPGQLRTLTKLAHKLAVADHIHFAGPLLPSNLVAQMHQADVIVAPLKACDRNLLQGCCPLKVLEGMASGTPVVTSNLPVVQAIGESGTHFLAAKPNSTKALKDALLQLRYDTTLRHHLSKQARTQVERTYTWKIANQQLLNIYQQLLRSAA
ncbi:MAG: glycosyltransferase [Leptolyngbya sp. SIO4C1]|nr:glycosyltransferase [Leptolyngbya sp. SIO4C1]